MAVIEVWRPIPGFDGYTASNMGEVQSKRFGRTMAKRIEPHGYLRVFLNDRKSHYVHRLVMLAFHGPSELQVNHMNGVRNDNRLENLEYCTHSENQKHSFRELGRVHHMLGRLGADNPLSRPIMAILDDGSIEHYENARDAVRKGGATNQFHVNSCCNRKRIKHAGKVWRYINQAGDLPDEAQ